MMTIFFICSEFCQPPPPENHCTAASRISNGALAYQLELTRPQPAGKMDGGG